MTELSLISLTILFSCYICMLFWNTVFLFLPICQFGLSPSTQWSLFSLISSRSPQRDHVFGTLVQSSLLWFLPLFSALWLFSFQHSAVSSETFSFAPLRSSGFCTCVRFFFSSQHINTLLCQQVWNHTELRCRLCSVFSHCVSACLLNARARENKCFCAPLSS